jgi:hypothetical protein
MAPKRASL